LSEQNMAFHYVCTLEQARELVDSFDQFWVTNCSCREGRGKCVRSRIDVCLWFHTDVTTFGSGLKEVDKAFVEGILQEAKDKRLVSRPFRYEKNMSETGGICFCCDDCCEYFLNWAQRCDKGIMIERTDMDLCTHCGICEDVCYFNARKMEGDELTINHDECYGCGLCREVCPEDCIQMVNRY
jgi:Pyruvate/2-oxoacid:ferredoxin oxidoreductase delta subunit